MEYEFKEELNARLMEAMERVADELRDAPGSYQYWAEPEFIETRARPGFVPYTDGGVAVDVGAVPAYCVSSGSYPSDAVHQWCDRLQDDASKAWEEETGESLSWVMDNRDWPAKTEANEKANALWDDFGDFEQEYLMEGCAFYYKARAIVYERGNHHSPDRTQDVVLFDVYLCMDSYGRDHISWLPYMGGKADQTEGDYTRVVPVAELSEQRLAEIVKEMSSQF
jgi:hypothetical protein